ncbi:alpha/beta fold hydrolase [Kitasatospora aureofaciens]|uniref:alpha/beta fold hydrolase n=1 Tax=Kitasatospora aureofaciens TaxID=1894 RepID=UPI001C47881A|nr:alpha/beta hydrolase [Kitasatospora aureofaciens]MBV6696473.1 alpha/beta hydrolase [Kitasatospora aureofaciens]
MSEAADGPVEAVAKAASGVSRAGVIGISVGVLAAGAAAGVAIDRLTVGRATRRRARAELDAGAPYGSLRGRPLTVAAPDGSELYVELDGTGWAEPDGDGAGPEPLTVVFCHGYCLNQDSWHFQRAALREGLRLVFWDQRSHGRSERSRSYVAGEPASIDQLGGDLRAVIDAVAPTGPLVLVGHSMGGMTVMALADQHPELFRERVAGVALVGTLAGNWDQVSLGLPSAGAKLFKKVAPGVMKLLGRQVELVEATRRFGSDVTAVFYRKFSFGGKDVDPGVVRFAEQLLDATPIDVVAEFYPVFGAHEKTAALAALRGLPALVLAGTKDLLTPAAHSEAMAEQLPGAELVLVEGAGHLVMLERPELVDRHLVDLLRRAAAFRGASPLPSAVLDEA